MQLTVLHNKKHDYIIPQLNEICAQKMLRHLILLPLFLFTLNGFSQTESTKTIFKQAAPKETVKIIIDMSDYDSNKIIAFKDRLTMFKGKIK